MNENLNQTYSQNQPNFQYSYPDAQTYQNMMRQAAMRQPQYNPYMQQQVPAIMQNYIKGRPVASFEEARAAQIDLDGSLHVFTDIGNKKIYTKQINPDGTATLNTYIYTEPPKQGQNEYVNKEEFYTMMAQFKDAFAQIRNALTSAQNQSDAATEQKKTIDFKF